MAATPQHIVLLYLRREKREETRSGFTLLLKLIATFQKFQIVATFSRFVFSFCPLILYFFLRRLCVVDIKTQELTTFVFILPLSVCHSLKRAKNFLLLFFIFFLLHYYVVFFNIE